MPLYAYYCQACQTQFDVRKRMANANTPVDCPDCHSSDTQRLISKIAIFSSGDGQTRALAGASPCSACSVAGAGCATCNPH